MARARNIKPGFFTNELLVELAFEYRLLFIGLWTLADKDGRLEDRPKRIKMNVFPADNVDVDAGLADLQRQGFLTRYSVDGVDCIQITNWDKHQSPHHTEKASVLPSLNNREVTVRKQNANGGNPPDSLIHRFSDSPIPDSSVVERVAISPVAGATDTDNTLPAGNRKGIVCGLLRKAGLADSAPSYLTEDTWQAIFAKRTNEEIVEYAQAKLAANPGRRIGLKYIAPGLLDNPERIEAKARASPAYRSAAQQSADTIAALTGRAGNGNHNAERDITGEAERVA